MYLWQGHGAAQGCGHGWGFMLLICEHGSSKQARSARCLSQWQWVKLKSSCRSLCNCLKKIILQIANPHSNIIIVFLRGIKRWRQRWQRVEKWTHAMKCKEIFCEPKFTVKTHSAKLLTRYYQRILPTFSSLLNLLEESKLQLVTQVLLIRPVSLEVPRKTLLNSRSQHSKRRLINLVSEIQQFPKVKPRTVIKLSSLRVSNTNPE